MRLSICLEFGDLEFTPVMRRLAGPLALTILRPLPTRILALLFQEPGQIATHAALLSTLTPEHAAGDWKASIRAEMFKLQTMLGILGVQRAEIREFVGLRYALVEPGSPDHQAIWGKPPTSPIGSILSDALAQTEGG